MEANKNNHHGVSGVYYKKILTPQKEVNNMLAWFFHCYCVEAPAEMCRSISHNDSLFFLEKPLEDGLAQHYYSAAI